MKLSEEMDNGNIPAESTKITKSSDLTSDKSQKSQLPTQNGMNYPAANVTNGNASHDHGADENAIGFEVESYATFNNSTSSTSLSDQKDHLRGPELNGNNHSSKNGDNVETNKVFSDESCTESTHNSSHMSEEFQLRLSDDESSQPSETISSSTPFKSSADTTKDEDGPSLTGSKTTESTIVATGLFVKTNMDSDPNKDSESYAQPLKPLRDHKLEIPQKDTGVEPEASIEDEIIKCHSVGLVLAKEETSLEKESDQSMLTGQIEKCAQLPSLEDALEAELEAELQAEIAAEMENKEKVIASKSNDSVLDGCTVSCSDKDTNLSSSIQDESEIAASNHSDILINLSDEKGSSDNTTNSGNEVISVVKTEDNLGKHVSIKEEESLKSEEMSLDCDVLPIKQEIKVEPTDCKIEPLDSDTLVKSEPFAQKTEESCCKSELFAVKSEESSVKGEERSVKSEESSVKGEECSVKGEECSVKSEESSVKHEESSGKNLVNLEKSDEKVTITSAAPDKGPISVTVHNHSEKNVSGCEDSSLQDSQEKNDKSKVDTATSEQTENEVDREKTTEPVTEQKRVIESVSEQVCSEALEAPESSKLDNKPVSASEPNSPFSDDLECQMSEFQAESDDACDIGDGISNENDSDTMCENLTIPEAERNKKSSTEGLKIPVVEKVSSSDLNDIDHSESSNFCDSTVMDVSCTDDTSRDSSNNANENITKGFRKRILSNSDDDSSDSFRLKKPYGLSGAEENSKSKQNSLDSHKRPAEVTLDIDSKKQRISNEDLDKEHDDATPKIESHNQVLQDKQQPSTKENLEDSASFSDSKPPSTNLSFLRKLHKNQLSKMSRNDLEELILQKMCEAITERSVVGELRLRCQALENRQEKENEKFNKLKKQMNELNIVMKKYMDNQRLFKPQPPIKVTRSVGLQVCPATKACSPACHFSSMRTRTNQQTPAPLIPDWLAKLGPYNSKPDSSLPDTSPQVPQAKQITPSKVNRSPSYSPRPALNGVSSTVPPVLVPTGNSSTSTAVLVMPGRSVVTSPRVPPLQQISTVRPRLSTPTASMSPQSAIHMQPKPSPVQHSSPQSTSQQKANDVEVIDIESEDHNKRPAGVQVSTHQHQHQQKQAANAAAQSLAGNAGMTVRLVSPTQTIPTSYSNFLVPAQGTMQPKMIIASSPPGNGIRGNFKLVMKSNPGNVINLLQSNGAAVTSSVVQLPSSAAAVQQIFTNAGKRPAAAGRLTSLGHPAPLPVGPTLQAQNHAWKQIPPRPNLKIQHQNNGIVLSWNMALGSQYADIESYQLFAYQESAAPPSSGLWKKVGDVKALPLPMACTLTQFIEGHKYHFTVRAVDKHGRVGPFSQQGSIRLGD